MKKILFSLLAVMLIGVGAVAQTNTYTKINSESELNQGDKVILVGFNGEGTAFAMSYQKSNNRHAVEIGSVGSSITTTVAIDPSSQTEPFEFTVGAENSTWTFFDELNNGYLYAAGGGNYLKTQTVNNDKGMWGLTFESDGGVVFESQGDAEQNLMRYNVSSILFGCYKPSSTVTDLVYIFKADGAPVVDPEPSNYPTGFNSTLTYNAVYLEWNASTGTQLPRGYLVVGSTGAIEVPVDGVPVANDTDASDGKVAYNVMSGSDVEFYGLLANSTFTFAIFPFTNTLENIDYKTDGTYPTVTVSVGDYHSALAADFVSGLAPFTAFNVEGEQEWTTAVYGGVSFAKMSGYANSAANVNEDWLISPNLFANGTYQTLIINFMNAYSYDGNPLKAYMSTTYDGVSDPTEFDWDDVTARFSWSEGSYVWEVTSETFTNFGNANKLYFAFVYTSTASAASTWEVTNVYIIGTGHNAVEENNATSFSIYPNPASSQISVVAEQDTEVQILDVAGRIVLKANVVEGVNVIGVAELESGVYFVRMNGTVVKFVKE